MSQVTASDYMSNFRRFRHCEYETCQQARWTGIATVTTAWLYDQQALLSDTRGTPWRYPILEVPVFFGRNTYLQCNIREYRIERLETLESQPYLESESRRVIEWIIQHASNLKSVKLSPGARLGSMPISRMDRPIQNIQLVSTASPQP